MKNMLINGCYDILTLKTLLELGVPQIGFDLRGSSANLVPFSKLKDILKHMQFNKSFLIFENDKTETVLSILNMLDHTIGSLQLQFRDTRLASYYHQLDHPFTWMFHPDGDWENILKLPQLKGVLLPLKWRNFYSKNPKLWSMMEARMLDIFLHADSFLESMDITPQLNLKISVDLTLEIEKGFRTVDQDRLKELKIWSLHENFTI